MKVIQPSEDRIWSELSRIAWSTRENAHLYGKTKVGASIYSGQGNFYSGCNIEHRYRCHDVHAEVNAVSHLVANGEKEIKRILVAAERNFFTPCGSCMDWIMQFADFSTQIGVQSSSDGEIQVFTCNELMPHYPN